MDETLAWVVDVWAKRQEGRAVRENVRARLLDGVGNLGLRWNGQTAEEVIVGREVAEGVNRFVEEILRFVAGWEDG